MLVDYVILMLSKIYNLASDFFGKDNNARLKLGIRVVCRELLLCTYVFIVFSKQIR